MKNLHAGHAVMLAMAAFILIMIQFMVRAYHNQETLVTEDYYAKELRYQEQIDKLNNASALGGDVQVEALPGRLTLHFPDAVAGMGITGELFLMKPDDAQGDIRLQVQADPQGRFTVDTERMRKGAYSMHLEWQVDGQAFLTEQRIHIP